MAPGMVQEHNLEKQIGCMTGFLRIFNRQQLLDEKRIYSAKRLPPAVDSSSESEQSSSPAVSKELGNPQKVKLVSSPDRSVKKLPTYDLRLPEIDKPAENPTKLPLPLPVFEFKEGTRSSWKLSREAPRLSLDSRATVDAKGSLYPREIRTNAAILSANRAETRGDGEEMEQQRRSTSVIGRLMGLEPPAPEDLLSDKKAELRRSASESRVSKHLLHSRFVDGINFHTKPNQYSFDTNNPHCTAIEERMSSAQSVDSNEYCVRNVRPEKAQSRGLVQRKSFFDSHDIFPEPKHSVTIYGEIERRLRMRGIDEASNDLETLKQILEAMQLKGLLHSGKSSNQRSSVHNRVCSGKDSPIVIMTPARSNRFSRNCNDSPPSSFRSRLGAGQNHNQRLNHPEIDRNVRNQARTQSPIPSAGGALKTPNGRRPLNIETQRKRNQPTDQRRLSPVHSPKLSPRRTVSDQPATNKSPRYRKSTADKDESSFLSESSIKTPSQTDSERSKMEYKEGRSKSLLERCDQLLLSIAEITATELQPSPVSVLDSSFYGDDSSSLSPSPVTKRSIDFKELEIELDDDVCTPETALSIVENDPEDSDFAYISEIFRVSGYLPMDSSVFQELEKQHFFKEDTSTRASRLHRKLTFDTIEEIIDRNRQLSTWKIVSNPNLHQTWSEFRRIRENDACEDLFELICGVLRKDLAGDAVTGWISTPIEMSESVLDIERLVFKDLIGDTIRELSNGPSLRRKLVF